MKYWHSNGSTLDEISQSELPSYAREGVYICCKNHNHSGGDCGFHVWVYANPSGDPPTPHEIKEKIKTEVPHVNGNGTHA